MAPDPEPDTPDVDAVDAATGSDRDLDALVAAERELADLEAALTEVDDTAGDGRPGRPLPEEALLAAPTDGDGVAPAGA
jgi:hypothetical protein